MSFEDYNYEGYNEYILIPKQPHGETVKTEVIGNSIKNKIDLTSDNLTAMNIPDYDHKSILSGSVELPQRRQTEVDSEEENDKEKRGSGKERTQNNDDGDSVESDVHIYYSDEEIAEVKRFQSVD